MEKKKIEFAALRRMAPGAFSEDMLDLLSKDLHFDNYIIRLAGVELGDDPFVEKINVTFFVINDKQRPRFKGQREGPKLFFTFSAGQSPEQNIEEFKSFVRDHAATAGVAPEVVRSESAGHVGD